MWIVDCPIRNAMTSKVEFIITFYNRRAREFYVIPGGADPIFAALRRRGFDPNDYMCTMFDITERKL